MCPIERSGISPEDHLIATEARPRLSIFVRPIKNQRKTEMQTKSNCRVERYRDQPADMRGLLARLQQLVDSRPEGVYTAEWMQESMRLGDIAAVAVALRR